MSGGSSLVTRYVAGFLVSEDKQFVALIRKERPVWQKGKLNGIGGHIEEGESPPAAMDREFGEETGQNGFVWRHTVTLSGEGFIVYFFVAYGTLENLFACREGATDEKVEIHHTLLLPLDTISNLRWIIPLSLDKDDLLAEVYETGGWMEPKNL